MDGLNTIHLSPSLLLATGGAPHLPVAKTAFLSISFKSMAILGTAFLFFQPSPELYAMWGVFATSAASVITNWITKHYERQERLDQARQVRQDVESAKQTVVRRTTMLEQSLAENTEITRQVGAKADAAYVAANHVNEKIAALAGGKIGAIQQTVNETNTTVHDIDSKVDSLIP